MTDVSFTGVRIATEEDQPQIYHLLMLLHRENGLFSFSDQKVRTRMSEGTSRQGGIIGVVDVGNGIEATVGLGICQTWYSDDWYLNELWNFVHPSHRKDGHAQKLINFSKWCAENMTLPLVMEVINNKRTEAKHRMYKRTVPMTGSVFMYAGTSGHAY